MTVSIASNSAKIVVTQRPTAFRPYVFGTEMSFTGDKLIATGEVTLNGAAGDDASGWTAGFIQAQWTETNWCYYRGQHNTDGSIFIQRGRPPARPMQACRDCIDTSPVSDIFYSTRPVDGEIAKGKPAGSAFPQRLTLFHADQPGDACMLVERNSLTGKPNYLAEAQLEFFFCTVLSVRDPNGIFHHLASFYWNQRWRATFKPLSFSATDITPAFQIMPIAAGTGASVGTIIQGAPTDPRFTGVLTSPQSQSCNDVFRAASAAVAFASSFNRHESRVWASFDVRRS